MDPHPHLGWGFGGVGHQQAGTEVGGFLQGPSLGAAGWVGWLVVVVAWFVGFVLLMPLEKKRRKLRPRWPLQGGHVPFHVR